MDSQNPSRIRSSEQGDARVLVNTDEGVAERGNLLRIRKGSAAQGLPSQRQSEIIKEYRERKKEFLQLQRVQASNVLSANRAAIESYVSYRLHEASTRRSLPIPKLGEVQAGADTTGPLGSAATAATAEVITAAAAAGPPLTASPSSPSPPSPSPSSPPNEGAAVGPPLAPQPHDGMRLTLSDRRVTVKVSGSNQLLRSYVYVLPAVRPPPLYTNWSYLKRNELARDHGRRMFLVDAVGETVPADDGETEERLPWEEVDGAAVDFAMKRVAEKYNWEDPEVLEALREVLRPQPEPEAIAQRLAYLQRFRLLEEERNHMEVEEVLDAYEGSFCRRCRIYGCRAHSGGHVKPHHRPAPPRPDSRGVPCGPGCWRNSNNDNKDHDGEQNEEEDEEVGMSGGLDTSAAAAAEAAAVAAAALAPPPPRPPPQGDATVRHYLEDTALLKATEGGEEAIGDDEEGSSGDDNEEEEDGEGGGGSQPEATAVREQGTRGTRGRTEAITTTTTMTLSNDSEEQTAAGDISVGARVGVGVGLAGPSSGGRVSAAGGSENGNSTAPAPTPAWDKFNLSLVRNGIKIFGLGNPCMVATLFGGQYTCAEVKRVMERMVRQWQHVGAAAMEGAAAMGTAATLTAVSSEPLEVAAPAEAGGSAVSGALGTTTAIGILTCNGDGGGGGGGEGGEGGGGGGVGGGFAEAFLLGLSRVPSRRKGGRTKKTVLGNTSKSARSLVVSARAQHGSNDWHEYQPCTCMGKCKADCPCVRVHNFCEKFCACSTTCRERFRGCACKSGCKTNMCPCWAAGRECDPDLCIGCAPSLEGKAEPGRECHNMRLRMRQHAHVVLGTSDIPGAGWGLFAAQYVPKNGFLGEYTGDLITQDEANRRGSIYDFMNNSYLFNLNNEWVVDAKFRGNKLRCANHSEEPVAKAKVLLVDGESRIAILADKNLTPGMEITYDYRYSDDTAPHWVKKKQQRG